MSNYYKTFLAALAIGTLGASAQTVTVVLNDGTQHAFSAERIKEMTFKENQPQAPQIALTQVDVENYGTTNVGLTLKDAYGDNEFLFDLYQPSAPYLQAGKYVVGASEGFHIDASNVNYTYYKSNGTANAIKSGEVEITNEGSVYTILIDVTIENGNQVRGKFIGELNKFSQYINVELSAMNYNTNPQPKGSFYVKGNDTNWDSEVAFVFFADPAATHLPAGTYTYAETNAAGTFNQQSYLNVNRVELKPATGSEIKVEGEAGKEQNISMNIITADGLHVNATFKGTISGTPEFSGATAAPRLKTGPVPFLK